LIDPEEICRIWEEYIRELFDDVRSEHSSDIFSPPIMESEVDALSTHKNGRTQGADHIHTEVLKLLNTGKLYQLFNTIYGSGNIPVY